VSSMRVVTAIWACVIVIGVVGFSIIGLAGH
jgi:hypothetical protein